MLLALHILQPTLHATHHAHAYATHGDLALCRRATHTMCIPHPTSHTAHLTSCICPHTSHPTSCICPHRQCAPHTMQVYIPQAMPTRSPQNAVPKEEPARQVRPQYPLHVPPHLPPHRPRQQQVTKAGIPLGLGSRPHHW